MPTDGLKAEIIHKKIIGIIHRCLRFWALIFLALTLRSVLLRLGYFDGGGQISDFSPFTN
jgi:hypothetical protein